MAKDSRQKVTRCINSQTYINTHLQLILIARLKVNQ